MLQRMNTVAAATLDGVAAAFVDIGAAAMINRVGLGVILKAVARGLLGRAAMQGGASAAALGFVLQLLMGALIGAIYGLGCMRFPALRLRWIPAGLAFGICVFVVMEFVVVPLSAVRKIPAFTAAALAENVAAMLLFGLIVGFAASLGRRPSTSIRGT